MKLASAPDQGKPVKREENSAATEFSIGIDFGGTNLRATALMSNGARGRSMSVPTRVADGPRAVLDDMARMVDELAKEFVDTRSLIGVGIGSPGPLELPSGILLEPPNLQGFHRFELKKQFEDLTGLSVIVESDANAAALAEWKLGAGRAFDTDSLCVITLGTGVGSGIILGGEIWHGAKGMSGEIGHTPIWPDGIPCSCGGRGCLEQYASATGIKKLASQRGLDPNSGAEITAKAVAGLARQGNSDAVEVIHIASHALGIGIAGLVNMLDLPLIVLGGGVSNAWDLMQADVLAALHRYSYVYRLNEPRDPSIFEPGKTNICRAQLGEDAGLIGASLLPFLSQDAFFKLKQG